MAFLVPAKFDELDVAAAHRAWGCNCGPAALAAVAGLTLEEARDCLPGFVRKGYTNPTMMFTGLINAGVDWHRLGANWPAFGLVRVQWEGPWTEPGVPIRARYRYTHWIGFWRSSSRGPRIFDVNCIDNGSGWVAFDEWSQMVAPALAKAHDGRATGGWHITHGLHVQKSRALA